MKKEMLINVSQAEECRIALLEDGQLEELYTERASQNNWVGNIYKGKIVNIEPSIQAAFVDFGVGRNGFLHISDVEPQYFRQGGYDPAELGDDSHPGVDDEDDNHSEEADADANLDDEHDDDDAEEDVKKALAGVVLRIALDEASKAVALASSHRFRRFSAAVTKSSSKLSRKASVPKGRHYRPILASQDAIWF